MNCCKTGDSTLPLIIYLQEIYLKYGRRAGGVTSHAGVFLPSELLSQHRCLPKNDNNDRTHKNDANTLS